MATANAVFVGMVATCFPLRSQESRRCSKHSVARALRFIHIDKGPRDHRGLHRGGESLPQLSSSRRVSRHNFLDRVPGQGSPVRRSVIGLADDGSSVLESCAVSLRGDEARCIIVQAPLEGTTLRVMFDGRFCHAQRNV